MFRRLLFSGVGVLTAIIALLGMKGVFSRILEVEGWTYLGFTMLFVMLVSAVIYLIYQVKNIDKYYKVIVISLFGFLTLSLVVASLSVYSTNHSWDVSVVKMLAETPKEEFLASSSPVKILIEIFSFSSIFVTKAIPF